MDIIEMGFDNNTRFLSVFICYFPFKFSKPAAETTPCSSALLYSSEDLFI